MSTAAHVPTVLVLGGAGFVGRHTVAALVARGARVIVGTRHPNRPARRCPAAVRNLKKVLVKHEHMLAPTNWAPLLEPIDAVVNAVGILRPCGRATYEKVHHLAPRALAKACKNAHVPLIHVSALGLRSDARSRFLSSKKRGEHALFDSGADVVVVRPSLLIGPGGFGARWLTWVANWPVFPLPDSARSRISALRVEELGECLARLACLPTDERRRLAKCVELGGPSLTTMHGLLSALRKRRATPWIIRVPAWGARVVAHVCDAFHLTPFSFGHFELLLRDNAPAVNHAALLLGRPPVHVALAAKPDIKDRKIRSRSTPARGANHPPHRV